MTIKIYCATASTSEESSHQFSRCCRSPQFEKRPMHVSRTNRKYSSIVCSRCGAIAHVVDETLISTIEGFKSALKRITGGTVD